MTLIRDYEVEETCKADVQHNIDLPQTLTVQRKTPCRHNKTHKKEKGTSLTSEGENDINTPCAESNDSLKKGHDRHPPPIGEDDKTSLEDDNNTFNSDKNSHLTSKGDLKTPKRDSTKCVPTFILDQKRSKEKWKQHKIHTT